LVLLLSYLANYVNPARIWQFAFFGLAYPVFLVINFGFLIFWILRRKMVFLISLVVILVGWENVARYMQIRLFNHKTHSVKSIKLISFNVRIFNQYNWVKGISVRDSILNFVNKEHPDVVFFQDFYTNDYKPVQSREYIKAKLEELPYSHLNYTYHTSNYSNFGVATYSKYPIIKKGCINFEKSYNSCIYSDIVINDDTIRFYNVHFESIRFRKTKYTFTDSLSFSFNSKQIDEVKDISGRLKRAFIKRAEQVDQVSRHINNSPYSVVVCGDFNDTPVSYTYQQVRGNLNDAFMGSGKGIGKTYRGSFPSFRIDYIFHSRKFESFNYQTGHIKLSDHYPVSCELEINK
jgi:endonuclease/exonuclease/phosphatase family metal-dependent hydrolase